MRYFFALEMEHMQTDIKEIRKNLKLNLSIHENKKCEYCDWNNNCCWCEWCGKNQCNNKRKLDSLILPKRKRNSTI